GLSMQMGIMSNLSMTTTNYSTAFIGSTKRARPVKTCRPVPSHWNMYINSNEIENKMRRKIKPLDFKCWANWTKIGQKVYHPFKFIDKI
ncbi:MAG: hypothetical protein PUH38_03255, partial [Acidaminococcus fermentans]|uniref:hypothetical protein n=1 Tax=Acidaminococcus fermentans TaxID=905 RepID=UPI00242D8AA1